MPSVWMSITPPVAQCTVCQATAAPGPVVPMVPRRYFQSASTADICGLANQTTTSNKP